MIQVAIVAKWDIRHVLITPLSHLAVSVSCLGNNINCFRKCLSMFLVLDSMLLNHKSKLNQSAGGTQFDVEVVAILDRTEQHKHIPWADKRLRCLDLTFRPVIRRNYVLFLSMILRVKSSYLKVKKQL